MSPMIRLTSKSLGVSRVYTPKDFEVSRIMGDIVDLVAERHGVTATVS